MSYELLQPWSTFVMKTYLPREILEKMLEITDEIVENKVGGGDNIGAGQIKDQFWVELKTLEEEEVLEYFLDVCSNYVLRAQCQSFPDKKEQFVKEEWLSQMHTMWINSQKDNEYLPMHDHTNCAISAVMYLKIPEYLPSRKVYGDEDDGGIVFTNNSSVDKIWGTPALNIQPRVGEFFIFPASQPHCVYPFRTSDGKGERRSVSFNVGFTSKSEQEAI